MQLLGVGCELLYVLDNKLRGRFRAFHASAAPNRKNDMVLEDIARGIFENELLQDMFVPRKQLSLQQLRECMLAVVTNPSLKIETGSFDRLFAVACMAMKANLLRVDCARSIVPLLEEKLTFLEGLFSNPHTKRSIERTRTALCIFYGSLSTGGLSRLRCAQLNTFRVLIVPVVALINEGYQLETGHLVPRKRGPNAGQLGVLRTFGKDGAAAVRPGRVSLADAGAGVLTHDGEPRGVANVFECAREQGMRLQILRLGAHARHSEDTESAEPRRGVVGGFGSPTLADAFASPSPPSSLGSDV
jgi:Organic solute transport protein 1